MYSIYECVFVPFYCSVVDVHCVDTVSIDTGLCFCKSLIQSKAPCLRICGRSSKPEDEKEKPNTEPNVEPESKSDTKTDEDVIQEPAIPVADDKSADIISDNTNENTDNPKTVETTNDSNEIDTPP